MRWLLACALVPACSFVFVQDPPRAVTDRSVPLECTSSRAMPIADLVIGTVFGAFVAGTTYELVRKANEDCPMPGGCYTPWKPALLATFLAVSPWGISSAVGFADTGRCRAAYRARGSVAP
jgi:hypothetical protein